MSSTYGGQDKAFIIALEYRDKILRDWIDNFIKNN